MRRAALIFVVLFAMAVHAGDKPKVDVSKIHGRIQFVDSFGDYKVKAVTSFPDLRVEIVESHPSAAGQWQIVDSFPDYKIQNGRFVPGFHDPIREKLPGPGQVTISNPQALLRDSNCLAPR